MLKGISLNTILWLPQHDKAHDLYMSDKLIEIGIDKIQFICDCFSGSPVTGILQAI